MFSMLLQMLTFLAAAAGHLKYAKFSRLPLSTMTKVNKDLHTNVYFMLYTAEIKIELNCAGECTMKLLKIAEIRRKQLSPNYYAFSFLPG